MNKQLVKFLSLFILNKEKRHNFRKKYLNKYYRTIEMIANEMNIKFRENTSDIYMFKDVLIDNNYEPLTIIKNPKFIIDAGANIGCTSVYLAMKYPNAKIIAIEPDESNFEILLENIQKYPNIIPLKTGLWNINAHLNVKDNGYSKCGMQTFETIEKDINTIESTTIQDIINKYNIDIIDILKIDIEGSEKQLFSSNYDWLSKVRIFSIETHDRMLRGCSTSLFKCMSNYPQFDLSLHWEDLIFTNNELLTK